MKNQKVEILEDLLKSFDQKNFDLDAWKIKASIVLKKIFGEADEKASLINNLHYDFSSWSLRDHSGGKQHDPIKDQAKEIIEAAIVELELSGDRSPVLEVMRNQLSGEEFDQLQHLIDNNQNIEASLTEYFSKIAPAKKEQILAQIILKIS